AQSAIALEDKNFYNHQGFSLLGIIRSVLVDILKGSAAQGGSTLTQQFVKNALLSQEKRISRKIKELILSYRIEQKYNKQEILQMYFNEIPYGSVVYGIQAAAQTYFNKDAKDLTLAEAATLAALTNAPSLLSPWGNHKDRLIARQHYALDQMVEQKYITKGASFCFLC
ncbi:MAG: transglycosylase domain-containing protein, partial [Candidatus Komeilibacteria bacterium]|nr:transglycosylase domain-containing protein [Candidatus Komeilibacteria bacterium]